MFDPSDNIPDPNTGTLGYKVSVLRTEKVAIMQRWRLLQFAKYVILEYLNGNDDPEVIVDEWLREA